MSYKFSTCLSNPNNYGGTRNTSAIKYICVHYTANKTDTAVANAKWFHNGVRQGSAHYFVDASHVVRSVPDSVIAYAVGGTVYNNKGGAKMHGTVTNANSISIEMCSTSGVISEATQAVAVELIQELMKKYNIPAGNIYRHFDVTGKCCPSSEYTGTWVAGDKWVGTDPTMWNAFLKKISGETKTSDVKEETYSKTDFVKAVQKALGVTVDGIAGAKTLAATVTVSASKNYKHAVVKPLQKYLNALGYDCGTADGVAGKKFTAAVKKYQTAKGCTADGEITAKGKTWKKLLGLS